jgi:hypothetical protein
LLPAQRDGFRSPREIAISAERLASGVGSDFLQVDVINLHLAPAYALHRSLEFESSGIRL